MMRTLFWILLLANVILFAAMRWGGSLTGETEPAALPALNPEKIQLAGAAKGSVAQQASAAAAGTPASPVSVAASSPAPAGAAGGNSASKAASLCMEWGEFSGQDLARAADALSGLVPGERVGRREVEYPIGYWVYIPPQKSKAGVAQKVAQLKARGIAEYFVVQEPGEWQHAISLGVFKTREAAEKFVAGLRAKDVNSAQVGERNVKLKETVFQLRGLDAAAAAKLAALRRDFPDSNLKEVACSR